MKVHGLIAIYEGKPVTDDYDSVLLFKTKEDALTIVPYSSKLYRVVTARVGRRPRHTTKENKS